jgi:hypothetical protein
VLWDDDLTFGVCFYYCHAIYPFRQIDTLNKKYNQNP